MAVLFLLINQSIAQKRYAILFGGENHKDNETSLYYAGTKSDLDQQEAIWNDTYLMWELLINKGFSNSDIIVLYHLGDDYVIEHPNILNQRYDPQIAHDDLFPYSTDHLTKMASTKSNLQNAINIIKNKITEDDFLVLFTYTHGSVNKFQCNNYSASDPTTYVTANELSSWLTPINCKKLILMQQCKGGSFIDELQGPNTIIMTATNDSSLAAVADQEYYHFDTNSGTFDYSTPYMSMVEFEKYTGTHEHIHSEWFLHLYSALSGTMPDGSVTYNTTYGNFPLSGSDLNSDGFITLNEANQRVCEFDSQQELHYFFFQPVKDDPQLSNLNLASHNTLAYTDIITTNIVSNKTYSGIIGINKDIHVTNGNTLTLGSKARLEMNGNASIIVDAGATLILNTTTIVGNNLNNKIQVNGSLQASNNCKFIVENGNAWSGLVLNSNSTVSLNNCHFENVGLTGYSNALTVSYCDFTNSTFSYTKGNLTIGNSNFDNTKISATLPYTASEVNISNSEVYNSSTTGIYINGYNQYLIEDCNIHENEYNGIYVYNAGSTSGLIKNNTIFNNGSGSYAGIRLYQSSSNIELNNISGNRYGVMCLNLSNTSIKGKIDAVYPEETQQIVNNDINQIYASSGSFPYYIKYNKISNTDNGCKVYYNYDALPIPMLNVSNNNWGRLRATTDFYPVGYYTYFPVWFFTMPSTMSTLAEKTFNDGLENKGLENYDESAKKFKKVIEKYPDSPYALYSLKELLAVEDLNKKDYKSLQDYFKKEANIQGNELLKKQASRISNRCDIKLGNYRKAIEWFENVIEDPETLEDSVFAIIDLADIYFLMENKKNAFVGKRSEFKFESKQRFEQKREVLIDLLLAQKGKTQTIEQETTEKKNEKETETTMTPIAQQLDFKVFPNPIKDEVHFQYQLDRPAQVCIKMFDYSGKEIAIVEKTYQEKGLYEKIFNVQNIKPGIYFYSFEINGKNIQTNKIIITK